MDKAQALHQFWSGFGVAAYDANTVPSTATYPRLTYEASMDSFDDPVYLTASIWYRSTSWAEISQKAQEISESIGMGGVTIPYDGGMLWVTRSAPFVQRLNDPDDSMIRRILLSVACEYLSAD